MCRQRKLEALIERRGRRGMTELRPGFRGAPRGLVMVSADLLADPHRTVPARIIQPRCHASRPAGEARWEWSIHISLVKWQFDDCL